MRNGHIRMVCFDWGGVILRICRSWAEGCGAAGIAVRGDPATPELMARRRSLSNEFQTGRMGADVFFARISESFGGEYSPQECRAIHDAWLIDEYPGVAAVIDRLVRVEHVATGLLSNTNECHWARQQAGVLPHYPTVGKLGHRHASHLLGLAKPGAEIYKAFERETGFRGGEILFFDDLPENVAAARSVGWSVEQVDHTGDTAAQIAACLREHGVFAD